MEHGNEPPARPNESGFPGNAPFQQAESMEYTAALTLSEDASGETYTSQTDGENALLVSASEVHVSDSTVEKTGSSTGESADFYGINAAVLAKDGANLYVSDATVTSSGTHANGIFSYGQGTSVTVSDTSIETTGDNSGGLMTTGGASMTANNVTVSTSGHSSAAIRSDRGGGKVTVNGGSFATSGVGSPAIYSTADITVTDAVLESTASEAVVIEGGNSVTLTNADLAGNNAILNGQSTEKTNVLIYQSMSGDAQEGSSTFTMVGGSLKSNTGSMFHVTNVSTAISLIDVDLTLSEDASTLLSATADSWGKSGSNGGHVQLTLSHQEAAGDIVTDAISSVTVTLSEGSSYTGAVNASQTGSASLSLDASSTWTLTGDSYLDAFEGEAHQINLNGYTLYVGGEPVVSSK
ncbi:MAG: hypothetical protein IJ229_03590 [Clostridia bacterium]|nr:hypothetical protein [Clostridia bacterium]